MLTSVFLRASETIAARRSFSGVFEVRSESLSISSGSIFISMLKECSRQRWRLIRLGSLESFVMVKFGCRRCRVF